MSGVGEQALLGACRGAAMSLALSVSRAARCLDGGDAVRVIGDVAAGWHAGLTPELQALFAMTDELANSAGLLKSA